MIRLGIIDDVMFPKTKAVPVDSGFQGKSE